VGIAFFIACYSAIHKAPMSPALLVLGDLTVQGNIKPLRSLTEPLQIAKDNGAKRALIPIENKRSFLDVSARSWSTSTRSSTVTQRPPR
jgi:ATP-dependent Lon protease